MLIGNPSIASVEVQSIWNSVSAFIGDEVHDPIWIYIFSNTYESIDRSIVTI
jgi:hypothetical protein